jgi:putative sterol carrier protein
MAKWLTQEWLDESTKLAVDQPERQGATARLQYRITGGPDGEVEYFWVVVDGKLIENQLGHLDDAEVTLVESFEDAIALQRGEIDANTAFMQGKIQVEGDVAKLMSLLPITMSPEFASFQAAVLAITEF